MMSSPLQALSVLTWNVWFDQFERAARYTAILRICQCLRPDVICFQEVTPGFIHYVKASTILQDYTCSDDMSASSVLPYGVMTLARKELRASFHFIPFPSMMSRKLLIADIPDWRGHIQVGNVHLESLANHPTREAQLQICADRMRDHAPSLYVLCGDFNFCSYRNFYGDEEVLENASLGRILPEARDSWLDLHDPVEDPGITFDGPTNRLVSNPKERMRYDRIVHCSKGEAWKPLSVNVIGNAPILDSSSEGEGEGAGNAMSPPRPKVLRGLLGRESVEVYPSDHFGLFARFALST